MYQTSNLVQMELRIYWGHYINNLKHSSLHPGLYLNSCSGSMTSLCNLASSPCGNFQRRLHRSQIKSIEKHRKTECGLEEPNSPILRRQPKIGIGVLLPLEGDEEKSK